MVEAAAKAILDSDEMWDTDAEWFREGWRKDARAAFDAIAPMVEKSLEMQSNGGYEMGYAADRPAVLPEGARQVLNGFKEATR